MEAEVRKTVEALRRIYGPGAVDEARRMMGRFPSRRDPGGDDFWERVVAALKPEVALPRRSSNTGTHTPSTDHAYETCTITDSSVKPSSCMD